VLPLVRYATGDLAQVADEGTDEPADVRTTCGARLHLSALVGRAMRPFTAADGRLIPPARFHALFSAFPIAEFQLTETSPGALRLAVEPRPGARIVKDDLEGWVRARAGTPIAVDVIFRAIDTCGGKFQRYQVLGDR
jgi:hypothetical protein